MKFGKLAAVAVFTAASAGFSAPVLSAPVSVDIRIAPPAPRHEVVPVARSGYTWAPGYWDYRHNRYQWVAGHWVRERPGYHYNAPQWVQRGDRWTRTEGRWERGHREPQGGWYFPDGTPGRLVDRDRDRDRDRHRDRDRDGIPNRYDHDRDNDGIRDSRDRDRDGDGVRNSRDSRPDNPRRD